MTLRNRRWERGIYMLKEKINLRLFDGAAAGGEGATGGDGNGVQAFGQPDGGASTKKGNGFENVVFGKQNDTAGVDVEEPMKDPKADAKQRKAAFEELIKGEYKDEYTKRFQDDFNRRHRDHKELKEKFDVADRLLGIIAEKYGERDVAKLEQLILNDNAHLEAEAMDRGMDVEQLAEIKRLKAEAESERRRRERAENSIRADEQYNRWLDESKVLKNTFPDFDLNEEIKNPAFMDMLQRGISVDHAYKVLHFDDIMLGTVNAAMKTTAKATADNIAARGNRPRENGNRGSAVIYKTDVSRLSRADRAEIAKRVASGETISF